MDLSEYVLLGAFLLPAGTLAAMNVALALSGEAGTLLLPSLRDYPKVDLREAVTPVPQPAQAERVEDADIEEELRRAA